MAIFRKVHTSFWSDSFISDLDKDKKLFYLYLLTNERTRQCGVYEITKKQISFDLGYGIDTVSKLLDYFIKIGKIRYNDTTKELAIGNWLKYNSSTSPKVKTCIDKEFQSVKDTVLIEYVKSMDTQSQEEEEEEEEREEEQDSKKSKKKSKIPFSQSLFFDKEQFKLRFPKWGVERLRHYYNAAIRYSDEGNKYVNWDNAIEAWSEKDDLQGKLKFDVGTSAENKPTAVTTLPKQAEKY